jgi:hypothetical protein
MTPMPPYPCACGRPTSEHLCSSEGCLVGGVGWGAAAGGLPHIQVSSTLSVHPPCNAKADPPSQPPASPQPSPTCECPQTLHRAANGGAERALVLGNPQRQRSTNGAAWGCGGGGVCGELLWGGGGGRLRRGLMYGVCLFVCARMRACAGVCVFAQGYLSIRMHASSARPSTCCRLALAHILPTHARPVGPGAVQGLPFGRHAGRLLAVRHPVCRGRRLC